MSTTIALTDECHYCGAPLYTSPVLFETARVVLCLCGTCGREFLIDHVSLPPGEDTERTGLGGVRVTTDAAEVNAHGVPLNSLPQEGR